MKGKWVYFTMATLLGIITSFVSGLFLLAQILLMIGIYRQKKLSRKHLLAAGIMFIIFFLRSELAESMNNTSLSENETAFLVTLEGNLKVDGDKFSAEGKELKSKEKIIISYRMKTDKEKTTFLAQIRTGLVCSVKGSLEEPPGPTNPNAFNYKKYLGQNQIYWLLKADQFSPSKCQPQKKTLLSFFRTLRENGIHYIQQHFPKETAPLAIALLFGDRNYIEADVLTAYQKLGIVHLLAISGLHVGMLVGMIYFLGIRAGVTRERMTTALLLFYRVTQFLLVPLLQ